MNLIALRIASVISTVWASSGGDSASNQSTMARLYCVVLFISVIFLIETNQHRIELQSKGVLCNIMCADGRVNFDTCTCAADVTRSRRSLGSTSKLIRPEFTTNNRCNNDEQWDGRACVSSNSFCPGGYHWNGRACIIQSSIQTAALVPSPPDKKCKYAKMMEELAMQSSTVMPTYSTSPMCPFGFIWSGYDCVHTPPVCPGGYVYRDNTCHFVAQPLPQITTQKTVIEDDVLGHNILNGNKWLQKPFEAELTQRFESVTDMSDESYDRNHQACCSIISPRICRRISTNIPEQWQCYHKTYRRCADICTKPRIYLRPRKSSFSDPILIMPPPPRRLLKLIQNRAHRESRIGMNENFFYLISLYCAY